MKVTALLALSGFGRAAQGSAWSMMPILGLARCQSPAVHANNVGSACTPSPTPNIKATSGPGRSSFKPWRSHRPCSKVSLQAWTGNLVGLVTLTSLVTLVSMAGLVPLYSSFGGRGLIG